MGSVFFVYKAFYEMVMNWLMKAALKLVRKG